MNLNVNLYNDITNSIRSSLNFNPNLSLNLPSNAPVASPNSDTSTQGISETNSAGSVYGTDGTGQMSFATILENFTNNPPEDISEEMTAAIASAADMYQLDPSLIRAVIQTESGGNPNAVSPAGAQGLMQLMPATARSLGVEDSFDVWENIHGGSRYIRQMLDRFDGDLELALAAYNAGAGNVERFGGVPPFRETQNYIPRIQRHKQNYMLEQYNLNNNNNQNV